MPDKEILKIYEDVGGIKITIGADTHFLEDISVGYDYASSLITGRLRSVVYINREPKLASELL
jgi:histidinol phosphatase-like PHP family hydrolase